MKCGDGKEEQPQIPHLCLERSRKRVYERKGWRENGQSSLRMGITSGLSQSVIQKLPAQVAQHVGKTPEINGLLVCIQ